MYKLNLPELGEGIKEATIACFHKAQGDRVEKDDDVVEVVTDKATFNIPAQKSGIILKILSKEGETVEVGSTLVVIDPQ